MLQKMGSAVSAQLSAEEARALTDAYLRAVAERYARLETDKASPPLDQVFFVTKARERKRKLEPASRVDLPADPERFSATDVPALGQQVREDSLLSRPLTLGEMLRSAKRAVLLGEPGSGKTTALQFITLTFAQGAHAERLGVEARWIPVFIVLQLRAADLAKQRLLDVIVTEVSWFLQDKPEAVVRALVGEHWLKAEEVLVLLDGLDEVAQDRVLVQENVARLRHERVRIVITSRPAGFDALSDFQTFELMPLEDGAQGVSFLAAWLRALEVSSHEEKAKQLYAALQAQPALQRFLGNPLFMRLSAAHYKRTGNVARNRADLYESWVEEAWARAQQRGATLQKEKALAALEAIAWHRQRGGDNEESALIEALRAQQICADHGEAQALLKLLCEQMGLLARAVLYEGSRKLRRYLFAHQTVREYLVAQHLKRAWALHPRRTLRFLKPRLHLPAWREPLLLLAASLTKEEAKRLAAYGLKARSPYESHLCRDLRVALELVAATGLMWEDVDGLRPRVEQALVQAPMQTRVKIVRALGELREAGAVDALLQALRDEDVEVRIAAAQALGAIGSE
ncbi:MAG: NACHT domain-containing protein, partial [Anaerolineae bacterium]|nr:NACHT domain-containing protein [Anaerolineae bacterium]